MKRLLIFTFVFTLFICNEIKALNIFELSIISGGTYFIYDQYFDQSLSHENVYQKKRNVLKKHDQTLAKKKFIDLSSRAKLINYLGIVESLHRRNNF